jgi:hypothetical protein
MNEQIEKLAIECYQSPEFDYIKFAELIVLDVLDKVGQRWSEGDIKQHFGVEE